MLATFSLGDLDFINKLLVIRLNVVMSEVNGLWIMVFNATFTEFYRGGQYYWWRKPEYPEKTTNLLQVTDNLCHIMLISRAPRLSRIRTHTISGDRH